jgi:hypothetical protein
MRWQSVRAWLWIRSAPIGVLAAVASPLVEALIKPFSPMLLLGTVRDATRPKGARP